MAEQSTNNNNSNKSTKTIIIIGIVVIIALLCAIIFLLLGKKGDEPQQDEKRAVVVTEEKAEQVADEMIHEEYIEPGYYECVMSTTWHFASGDVESDDAYVENVINNTNDVYFDLFLAEDEENAIYKSPIIPRGSKLENIKLDTALPAGTHDCLMIYHMVDEDQKDQGELRVGLTVVVDK